MGNTKWISSFENYVRSLQEKYKVPGIVVGLSEAGNMIYDKGFGFRNIDKELVVTGETIFGIASVTKSFTCAGIMQLQERGKLKVHDKVKDYIPEFTLPDHPEWSEEVTIHHFMTHTTGLPPLASLEYALKRTIDVDPSADDYPGLKLNEKSGPSIDTYEQLIKYIGDSPVNLLGKPGEQFSYSNDCYALLGAIISRVSEQSYEDFITENILEPAGMENSTFDLEEVKTATDVTTQYSMKTEKKDSEVYAAPVWWDAPAMRGAGFLRSTMSDMLRYAQIYCNEGIVNQTRILSEDSVKQMTSPYIQFEPNRYYGYGLMVTPNFHGGTLVEHGGSLKAISSQLSIIPEKGLAGIVLTNLVGVPAFQLMQGALNGILGLSVETPLANYETANNLDEDLSPYVGVFTSEEGASMEVTIDDGSLLLKQQGKSFALRPIAEHQFAVKMKEADQPIRFLMNDKGSLRGLAIGLRQVPLEK